VTLTFISFVNEDACIAQPLARFLGKNGFKVFLTADEWTLYAGELWLDRIRKELGEAEIVLALFSKRSVSRPWIHFEAGAAWLSNKLLIPVCVGSFRAEELPIPYRGIQSVHLTDYGSSYYLLRSMSRYCSGSVPPPISSASEEVKELSLALSAYQDPS
jgi:hypothetical protein